MRFTPTPARVLAAASAMAAVAAAVALVGGTAAQAATITTLSVVVAVTAGIRMLQARGRARVVFALMLAGFVLMVAANALWIVTVVVGGAASSPELPHRTLLGLAYGCLFAAALLVLAPTIRRDAGGVLDATILGVAVASGAWQAFLAPELHAAEIPLSQRTYVFVIAVVLSGSAGIIIAIGVNGSMPRSARSALGYFTIAILTTVAANAANSVLSGAETGGTPSWVEALWAIAYSAVWAAIAHPAGPEAFLAGRARSRRLTTGRLLVLGGATLLTPVIAMTRAFAGEYVGWLAGAGTSVVIIVMMLVRVNQLASAHLTTESRLRKLADHDVLTGLPNRRAVEKHLDELTVRLASGDSPGAVVCFVDLVGFTAINASRGPAIGDELLAAVADRLTRVARIDGGDLVGRLGGDEFIVIVESDPAQAAAPVSSRIEQVFDEPLMLSDGPATAAASIGVATAQRGEHHTGDALLTRADDAMYAQKRTGRKEAG